MAGGLIAAVWSARALRYPERRADTCPVRPWAVLVVLLLAAALPGQAAAARFDQPPPAEVAAGAPITFALSPSGFSVSSGVAVKLSNEPAWHRCLAPGQYTATLPPGGYVVQIADDTNRPWFDANEPSATTPEC